MYKGGDKTMKGFRVLSYVFAAGGVLLVGWSFLGRFIDARTVMGCIIPGGVSASSAMIGADTFLLLAILAYLYKKD
jgi:hypothetical protein